MAFTDSPSATDFGDGSRVTPDFYVTSGNFNHTLDLSIFSKASNGQAATIQIVYNGGDGNLYQCGDVILSVTYLFPFVSLNLSSLNFFFFF